MNWLGWLNLAELIIGTAAGGAFMVLYTVRYRWWRDEFGKHLMSFSAIAWLFYAFYLVVTLARPETAPGNSTSPTALVRFVLFSVLTVVIVWRLVIFLDFRRYVRAAAKQPAPKDGGA
jgi:uncharacterized membrane protein YbhN (UPF0104 family)